MQKVSWGIFILLTLLTGGIWYGLFQEKREDLTVVFLNVGQGDAAFIESPTGTQVLIDGGPNQSVLRELGRVMPFYDRSIDVVIATHGDKDHIGGLPEVLKRFDVDMILESGNESTTDVYDAFKSYVSREEGAVSHTVRRKEVIDLGGGVYLRILFPDRDVSEVESNTASVIAQLVYGDTEMLFTGDSPKSIETYLVQIEGDLLSSEVLKIGHHGSRTSSDELFLSRVHPMYAIISRGCDNRYGHPHQEVLENLREQQIIVKDTCTDGRVVFTSDGETLRVR